MITNITDSDYISISRAQTDHVIDDMYELTQVNHKDSFEVPKNNERYSIKVETYKSKEGTAKTWGYTKFIVTNKKSEIVAKFNRNYYSAPYCYVIQNDNVFLITSEDYQCITIINLTTGVINTYGDLESLKIGGGFCPVEFSYDESTNELCVYGCIWGGPYEYRYFKVDDLNNPDFTIIKIVDKEYEEDDDDDDD